jgi:siroheme synthase
VTPRVGQGETPTDWAAGAAAADTLAIYMGASQAAQVAATLIAQGKPAATPVALVENATLDGERHLLTTLGVLLEGIPLETQGPVLILAGRAAEALAARAFQTETLPLPLLLSH